MLARVAKEADAPEVHRALLGWYAVEARDLPWRGTHDPYAILVAEVMLQQTQVERVIPRWHAWLDRFPTLQALADSARAEVIRAWQGLGYNQRAIRLHDIAGQAVAEWGGDLPRDIAGLLRLKGIGRYTAGAVACFAYQQPVAMVDTNVRRVLGRVFGVDSTAVDRLAERVVPGQAAYPWNQALMDLGATVCQARAPKCLVCPLVGLCAGPGPAKTRPRAVERFRGSRRFYRGRLVDAVRALSADAVVPLERLVAQVAPAADRDRVTGLARTLATDGLLSLDGEDRASLPR